MKYASKISQRITRVNGVTFDYQFDTLGGIPEGGNCEYLLKIWYGGKEYEISCSDGWNIFFYVMEPDGRRMICGDDHFADDLMYSDLADMALYHYAMVISLSIDVADQYMALEFSNNGRLWRMNNGELSNEARN